MRSQPHSALRLEAMALAIPEWPGHPNRVPFSGVLTRVDTPSDRAPSGAAGHRVMLPRAVAERALPSLLGMAVDYSPGLRGHDARRKIGVITRAEIAGDRLEVGGYLFARDFPDVLRDFRAQSGSLGMSYEVAEVRVADAGAAVWKLEHVVFTGAAILERTAAAYQSTSLAAAAGCAIPKGETMNDKILKTLETLAQASQAAAAEMAGLRTAIEALQSTQNTMALSFERTVAAHAVPASLETRVDELTRAGEELRRQNAALRAQAEAFSAQVTRKTIPAQLLTLLAKSGVSADALTAGGRMDAGALDRALEGLPVEQRIAVKSQLARAGAIE
jgi:hypothetical protein